MKDIWNINVYWVLYNGAWIKEKRLDIKDIVKVKKSKEKQNLDIKYFLNSFIK